MTLLRFRFSLPNIVEVKGLRGKMIMPEKNLSQMAGGKKIRKNRNQIFDGRVMKVF